MKNFLRFLVLPLLFSFFYSSVFASPLSTQSNIEYTVKDDSLDTHITIEITNNQRSPLVLNYYELTIPHKSVSAIDVRSENKKLAFSNKKTKGGLQITIDTNTKVIPPKSKYILDIYFNCAMTFDKEKTYGKVISKLPGLTVKKVTVNLSSDFQSPKSVEGAKFTWKNYRVELTDIVQDEVSILFMDPMVYRYDLNKTVINDSQEEMSYEIPIPATNYNQKFIFENLEPIPSSVKKDQDGNIILKFLINPEKQLLIKLSGYIVKENSIDEKFGSFATDTVGYWNITNSFELSRINKLIEKNPVNINDINNYILDRLEIDKNSFNSTNSFENILRGGADVALNRKNNAVVEDYNDFLITVLRMASIPSRLVLGYIPNSSSITSQGFFHSWVEYYDLKENTWNIADPSLQDLLKEKLIHINSQNYITFITRQKNPLLPKLPYLNSNDLQITAVNIQPEAVFSIEKIDNMYVNTGNVPAVYTEAGIDKIIVPKQKMSVNTIDKFISLEGKVIEFELNNSDELSKPQIFTYSLIFFLSVFIVFLLNFMYSFLRRLWK